MAVIIKDMDMPKNCGECKLTYCDTGDDAYFGPNVDRCVMDGSLITHFEKQYDCPLKSVEELINGIKDRSYPIIYNTNNVDYGLTIKDIGQMIKEYCGME